MPTFSRLARDRDIRLLAEHLHESVCYGSHSDQSRDNRELGDNYCPFWHQFWFSQHVNQTKNQYYLRAYRLLKLCDEDTDLARRIIDALSPKRVTEEAEELGYNIDTKRMEW